MERWRILPSVWDNELSEDDKAQLMEYVIELAEMKAWEDYLSEKERIRAEAKRNLDSEMRAKP